MNTEATATPEAEPRDRVFNLLSLVALQSAMIERAIGNSDDALDFVHRMGEEVGALEPGDRETLAELRASMHSALDELGVTIGPPQVSEAPESETPCGSEAAQ